MADLGSTPNLTTLSGFGDSRVVPGDKIYVTSADAEYVYRLPPAGFVADGVHAVKALFLAGTWILPAGPMQFQNVADLAELQTLDVTSFFDGTHCWVRILDRAYILKTTSQSASADSDTYNSATAGRLWMGFS